MKQRLLRKQPDFSACDKKRSELLLIEIKELILCAAFFYAGIVHAALKTERENKNTWLPWNKNEDTDLKDGKWKD